MSLSEIWLASPEQLSNKQVKQLVSFSGDGATAGQLRDESEASREFHDFLEKIPSEFLSTYIPH